MKTFKKELTKVLYVHISQEIKNRRVKAKMSQAELAASIGYMTMRQIVDNWENGQSLPPLQALCLMSIVFGCSIQDFFPSNSDITEKIGIELIQVSHNAISFIDQPSEASQ